MNARAELRMDAPTFLRWAEGREGRHELAQGEVRSMVGASRDHVEIAVNLVVLLRPRLDRARYRVAQGDFAVEVAGGVRYPDVMVSLRGAHETRLSTREPVVLVEVLSPSSVYIDFDEKRPEYVALPSLRTYAVFSQEEPRAWVWERGVDGEWPEKPAVVEGRTGILDLPSVALRLPMAEIYAGVGD